MTDAPADIDAERIVIGAAMQNPRTLQGLTLNPNDFYRPAHETIWRTILNETAAGRPTDIAAIKAALDTAGQLTKVGGPLYLLECTNLVPLVAQAAHFAGIVTDRARRRRLIAQATTAIQWANESVEPAEAVIERAADALTELRYQAQGDDGLESMLTLDEFCDQPLPARTWVVGDLLGAGERLVITGSEGLGKSMLSRQIAVAAAAGLHPFTLRPCEPRRVLAVDLENPLEIMVDTWSTIRAAAAKRGRPVQDGRLMIDRRTDGLNLDNINDQRWLTRRVETYRPDVLVIGPIYKLYVGGDNSREETLARMVTSFMDKLRATTGCALVLEHHSPHASPGIKTRTVRPIGSSLWLRWSEFGYGIRMVDGEQPVGRRLVDLVAWRGPRAERPWPERLESGGQSGWPWLEAEPDSRRGWAA